MPGTVLGAEDTSADETGLVFCFRASSPPFFLKINIKYLESCVPKGYVACPGENRLGCGERILGRLEVGGKG